MPLYYQDVRGTTALAAGVMLVPQGVDDVLSRPSPAAKSTSTGRAASP